MKNKFNVTVSIVLLEDQLSKIDDELQYKDLYEYIEKLKVLEKKLQSTIDNR